MIIISLNFTTQNLQIPAVAKLFIQAIQGFKYS